MTINITARMDEHMTYPKMLIQMSGAPGSGKSTTAKLVAQAIDGIVIDHDRLRTAYLDHDVPFEQAARLAYSLQWVLAEYMLRQKRSVIVDSTCNYDQVLRQGKKLALKSGCLYRYLECRIDDIEVLDRRLKGRVAMRSQRTGIHHPPRDVTALSRPEDHIARFEHWIKHPYRPATNIIQIDSSLSPDQCRDQVLQQLFDPEQS